MEKEINCLYCGTKSFLKPEDNYTYTFVECPTCGRYECQVFPELLGKEMKDKIASYLYYTGVVEKHEDRRFFNLVGSKQYFKSAFEEYPWCHYVSLEEVKSFYPNSFSERVTKILLGFAKRSEFLGDFISFTKAELLSALFVNRYDKQGNGLEEIKVNYQYEQIMKYLMDNKYVEISENTAEIRVRLLPEGWKRIDELQLDESNNKNVFVSMAFNEGTKDTREAIREGIIRAGYSPEFIDEIIHNKQIVPEMFRLIRESRFLILDITDPNYGAYYEAGYALGLGKEVIICCKAGIFSKQYETDEERKYQKYLKPHFDIAQKQILVWEDYDDLKSKLSEWIKAIIG